MRDHPGILDSLIDGINRFVGAHRLSSIEAEGPERDAILTDIVAQMRREDQYLG